MSDDAKRLVAMAEAMQALVPEPEPYTDTEDTSVVEGLWAITNNSSCEWALMRAARLRLEKQEIEEAAAEACRRINARAASLTAKLDRGIGFFEGNIAKYATENREAILGGGKKKSRTYLYGTVGWRKSPGGITVTDPEALKAWLLAQDDKTLYRTKIEPDMVGLKRRLAESGTVPPGTEVKPESEKLYIDPVDPTGPLKKGTP